MTPRAAVALVVAALVAAAGACGAPPPHARGRDVTVWRPIGSWSGRGLLQTEAFIGETGSFRMRWQTSGETAAGTGTFRVVLHSSVSGRPLLVAIDHRGVGGDTSYVTEDPREFFIVVQAANLQWTLSVDEAVRATAGAARNH